MNPDQLYLRQREELLDYEDARLNSLLQAIPNFYVTRNDQSLWGLLLRGLAMELARLDYAYAYELVNKDPRFLTPPDMRRRWAAPLFVSKNYPLPTQSDLEYKAMMQELLAAYSQGATPLALEGVVKAYTGRDIQVQELFKQMGTFYDISDHNAVGVTVRVGGDDPMSEEQDIGKLRALTSDLYLALDVIKPAHVGLNFTAAFGADEDMNAVIDEIVDNFRIYARIVEEEPLDPTMTLSPYLNPNSPNTHLAAEGNVVGKAFAKLLLSSAWQALAFPSFQAEYAVDAQGNYALRLDCYNDVALTDAQGNYTGQISKARGVLAPRLNTAWEITSDEDFQFEVD